MGEAQALALLPYKVLSYIYLPACSQDPCPLNCKTSKYHLSDNSLSHKTELFFDKGSSSTDLQGKKKKKGRRGPFISGTSEPNQYLVAVLTHACLGTALLKTELAALALLDLPLLHLLTINSLLLFYYQDNVVPA